MTAPERQKPQVAAVIAAYRRDAELARLLRALEEGPTKPARAFVADNAASEATREVCRLHGAEWIPLADNRGPGPAWNAALRAALSDRSLTHCLVLDDDVVPPAEALSTLVEVMTSTGSGAVAPLLYDEKGML